MAGSIAAIRCFTSNVRNAFVISKATIDTRTIFNETAIAQNELGLIYTSLKT